MKKLAAITLITLFLFNLVGYRLIFNYAQHQSDVKLEASIDNAEYNEAELLTIKIPVSVPYQLDRQDFERVDGEITYEGKIYKYVKRKVVNGELILKCLPNQNKMRLQSAKDEFFKTANDLVQHNTSKKSDQSKAQSFKNILGDFLSTDKAMFFTSIAAKEKVIANRSVFFLATRPHRSPEQPPDFI